MIGIADPGDIVVVTFFRSRLNPTYLRHTPLEERISPTQEAIRFEKNMRTVLPDLAAAGLHVVLVKDTLFMGDVATLERCAFNIDLQLENGCAVSFVQDVHDRTLQSDIFDRLAASFPDTVRVVDPTPTLYAAESTYAPVTPDGSFRIFDRHHLTEAETRRLVPFFEAALP